LEYKVASMRIMDDDDIQSTRPENNDIVCEEYKASICIDRFGIRPLQRTPSKPFAIN
jgi:hypothetical protein